ncbi:hypothetical protein JIN77_08440 [Verrucomicrobiaceae bacterium R5-34]|uniref:Uncharacterized protein n=1 Tax=Oceaniferula flava TaxID=2800421 RepID=A0AAE2SE01_9BACT|nr:hypothetical protein [Oceaniferula flavus]MBK1830751.1 hypothetical protein [Verrucomicrobiaceae bacterium R5-34]MBK1856009.1 hypothetical protein [Oceaniferula flavus]MBM1137316.1 hypothetical protein [Oceaniferula flavus]
MEPLFDMMKKRRPSLNDCGVKPLAKEVHHFLLSSYLMWPVIVAFGHFSTNTTVAVSIIAMFMVLGFLFYNLLVAMVQMSHHPKKRLRISQWIFYVSLTVMVLRIVPYL